jgi:CheY-like chemotaxis protein
MAIRWNTPGRLESAAPNRWTATGPAILTPPVIDGLEVCRQLCARWPIPVAMLATLVEETDRVVVL